MRPVTLLVLLLALPVICLGAGPGPVLIAHRGLHKAAPQNSLPALREAIWAHVDYVEVDTRTTADGLVVDHHDADLPGLGEIASLPYSRIKALDLGAGLARWYRYTRVPLFVEELALGKGRVHFYVDMKAIAPEHLVWLLQQFDMVSDAVCYGGVDTLATLRRLEPRLEVMPHLPPAEQVPALVANLHPRYVESGWQGSPELAAVAHQHGAKLFLDIADTSPEYVLRCARAGVDGLQTDDPEKVMRILEQAGFRPPRTIADKSKGGDPLDAARQAIARGKTPLRATVHRTADSLLACILPHLGWPPPKGIAWGKTRYAVVRGGYPGSPAVPLLGEVLAVARGRCGVVLTLAEADREQALRLAKEFGMEGQVQFTTAGR